MHRDILQRFGALPRDLDGTSNAPVWIHAVSVGEAAVAAKLASEIKKRFPATTVAVSTTTRTGNEMIRKYGKGVVDGVFYYPLDISFIVSKVVRFINPRVYVVIETELWPNLLSELKARGIPVVLVNGRISDSSFENYKKIKFITKGILGCVSCFCMQSQRDSDRIEQLGAKAGDVFVTGNIKFDERLPESAAPGLGKKELGFDETDEVIVAGSTHFPEEAAVIGIYQQLRVARPGLKLILAPRHIERIDAIKVYLDKTGLEYAHLSEILGAGPEIRKSKFDVLLVDTIGHLRDLYGAANVVFIGGSLAKKGGQNPIEAALWGKAVVFGPNMQNFREIADIFIKNTAAVQVKDASQLQEALEGLLKGVPHRRNVAENARNVIEKNSGALARTVDRLGKYLERQKIGYGKGSEGRVV